MSERRLYLGAPMRCVGWEVYSDSAHPDVDKVGPLAPRMQGVPDQAYTILYANAVNRLDPDSEALAAMCEWHRILKPGGALICVGLDASAVGAAMARSKFDDQVALSRLLVQRSHWTAEVLSAYLQIAGFRNVRRTERPGLFADVSELAAAGARLSLCVLADRP